MDGDQPFHVLRWLGVARTAHAHGPVLVVGQDSGSRRDSRVTG